MGIFSNPRPWSIELTLLLQIIGEKKATFLLNSGVFLTRSSLQSRVPGIMYLCLKSFLFSQNTIGFSIKSLTSIFRNYRFLGQVELTPQLSFKAKA